LQRLRKKELLVLQEAQESSEDDYHGMGIKGYLHKTYFSPGFARILAFPFAPV
jgi:hypothetical protein